MNRPLTNLEETDTLARVAVERIREDAGTGRLVKRGWFLSQIYFWGQRNSPEETKAWAADCIKDATAARSMISAWRQDIISTSDTVRRIPVMDGEGLDRLIGFELLDTMLGGSTVSPTDESNEGIALRLYAEAKAKKAAGKPYKQVTLPGSGY